MNNNLLSLLANAQTHEARARQIHGVQLQDIKKDAFLYKIVCAAAIPHWFNRNILRALLPDLQADFSKLYTKLFTLDFVETIPQMQGYRIQEFHRKWILEDLFNKDTEQFLNLSKLAALYFSFSDEPMDRIEWLYHLIITDDQMEATKHFWKIAAKWHSSFFSTEIESLVNTLMEQVDSGRVTGLARGGICFWQGQTALQAKQGDTALQALKIAAQELKKDTELLAETTRTIGKVQQELFHQPDEALENYEQAQELYGIREDWLNKAKTLRITGNLHYSLEQPDRALEYYQQAQVLYQEIGSRVGQARTLEAMGEVLTSSHQYNEALSYYQKAQSLYRKLDSHWYEAQTYRAMSELYTSLNQPELSTAAEQKAQDLELRFQRQWLSEAKNPYNLSDSQYETFKAIFAEPTRTDISWQKVKELLQNPGLRDKMRNRLRKIRSQRDKEMKALSVVTLRHELVYKGYELPF
ncbi:MAG: tetratricopeptide repeat protein [Symploca sp. SIO2E6]|nr:tetratricopeptide repeat protein [Symploca sp. SIO2E6]